MGALDFAVMSACFRIRDWIAPPERKLAEAGIEPGFHVLDYGCGPGGYSIAAARLVGPAGKVYAADNSAHAIRHLRKLAAKKGLRNIEAIETDCATGLPDASVDVVLLYDTFHDLAEPDAVLRELHRVLKPRSVLSFSDHHLKEDEVGERVARGGLFELSGRGRRTYTFRRRQRDEPQMGTDEHR